MFAHVPPRLLLGVHCGSQHLIFFYFPRNLLVWVLLMLAFKLHCVVAIETDINVHADVNAIGLEAVGIRRSQRSNPHNAQAMGAPRAQKSTPHIKHNMGKLMGNIRTH